jgi:hypothetical protein
MSRPIIVDKDFPVQGFGQPLEPTPSVMTNDEVKVLNSPTGKYPAPLQDNPPQHPSRYEAARALAIKNAQFPKY